MHNTGQDGGTADIDVGALAACPGQTTGSTNIIVAVIDTGIRYTHQDLAGQMWINEDEIAGNGVDDDNDGYIDNVYGIDAVNGDGDPMDDNNHGTHCAGTIGARANDGNPRGCPRMAGAPNGLQISQWRRLGLHQRRGGVCGFRCAQRRENSQ